MECSSADLIEEKVPYMRLIKTTLDSIFKKLPTFADFSLRWRPFETPLFEEDLWKQYLANKQVKDMAWLTTTDPMSRKLAIRTISRHINQRYLFTPIEMFQYYKNWKLKIPYKIPSGGTFLKSVFAYRAGLKFLSFNPIHMLEDRDIIDGGAASGDSSLLFAEYHPRRVYAFEPSIRQREEIRTTFDVNNANDIITIVPFALGELHGTLTGRDQYGEFFSAETISIDEFAHGKDIACIKLDIEGAEFPTLRGALNTIQRCKPLLIICLYHRPEDLFEIPDWLTTNFPDYHFISFLEILSQQTEALAFILP